MGPTVEHDFTPPPQPPVRRWVLLAAMAHVPLLAAMILGIDWQRQTEDATSQPRPAPAQQTQVLGAGAVTGAPHPGADCPIRPLLAAGEKGDGQLFPLAPADVALKKESDINAFLVAGKEAAAAGQRRDAEVAYLTSCRVANALKGPASLASAEARYQLGSLYASVARGEGTEPLADRAETLKRAQAFYADSLNIYKALLGESHEKTRFAAEGLSAVDRLAKGTVSNAPPVATVPVPAPVPVSKAPPAPPEPRVSQAPAATASVQAPPKPSFDCAKARSRSEKLICADPELAQLDRDLGRLHARAKSAAANAATFKRENDKEWRRREATCRDRECLRQWYAQRRAQLLETVSEARPQPDREASR